MKHTFVIAGIAALAISAPVLAQSSPSLAAVSAEPAVTPAIVLAQALVPAPAPAIVAQFNWEVGKYVQKTTATATYVPGHWQQYSDGWGWVPGEWNYQGVGSSTPQQ